MTTAPEREALAQAVAAMREMSDRAEQIKAELDAVPPSDRPACRHSSMLTWPLSTLALAIEKGEAALAATPPAAAASTVPDGWKLVMVPDAEPSNEPDWEEVLHQSEMATGLKIERHAFSIVICEVRRWLAHRSSAAPAAQDEREPTDAMVAAYLAANDAYWKGCDVLPEKPGVWRNGTPTEATRVSLHAALAARAPQAAPEVTSPSEAVYAFAAWLTCRREAVIFGATYEASPAAEAVEAFVKSQGFEPPRHDYTRMLKPYPAEDETTPVAPAPRPEANIVQPDWSTFVPAPQPEAAEPVLINVDQDGRPYLYPDAPKAAVLYATPPAPAQQSVEKDAARYRWLREQDWFSGELCVLRSPKKILTSGSGLGADCPSRERLDEAIDAEINRNH